MLILVDSNYVMFGDKTSLFSTHLNQYHNIGINKQNWVGVPYSIIVVSLNAISAAAVNKVQVSRKVIKSNPVISTQGTEHEKFDPDWVWRRICEL